MFDLAKFIASPWFAVAAGVVGQVLGTQKLKFALPEHWSAKKRSRVTEFGIALPMGWIPPMVIYAGMNGWAAGAWHTGFWLGFMVWLAGIIIYKVAAKYLAKTNPELAEAMSVDKRVKTIQTPRGFKQVDEDYDTDHEAGEVTVVPAGSDKTEVITQPREKP